MELRGMPFGASIEIVETLTLEGDTLPRARSRVYFGAGAIVSDGRACVRSLSEYLASGLLDSQTKPFLIAFRPTGDTADVRMQKTQACAALLQDADRGDSVTGALVLDFSLLSLEDASAFKNEIEKHLSLCERLPYAIIPQISMQCPPDVAGDILGYQAVDALLVAGTLAWGDIPARAQKVFFGTTISPLARIGGGRVSGKYILPLTIEWIRQVRRQFISKPVIAGGGVLRVSDVNALVDAGASAIVLDCVRTLRPWNVWRIARRARALLVK